MTTRAIEPGMQVSGHLISEQIGHGGYARVFRAAPVAGDGAAVAVKVCVRPELVRALRDEGEVLRRLQGPRFVEIIEEHLDHDPPYFLLELCEGFDLRRALVDADSGRLVPDRVLELAEGILEGIAFAHDEGVVHGDLKPENVLLTAAGAPKIADLGLSRTSRQEMLTHRSRLTRSLATDGDLGRSGSDSGSGGRGSARSGRRSVAGAPSAAGETRDEDSAQVRGTFDYLAPEVRAGGEITPQSDVFALGVLLYELLTGRRPQGLFKLPAALLADEGVRVPVALDRVIARALSFHACDRYPDAGTMLRDLLAGDAGLALDEMKTPAAGDPAEVNPLLLLVGREDYLDRAVFAIVPTLAYGVLVPLGVLVGGAPRAALGALAIILGMAALFIGYARGRDRLGRWWLIRRTRRALTAAEERARR